MPAIKVVKLRFRTTRTKEDIGTARLVARARRDIAAGAPLIPKEDIDRLFEVVKSERLHLSRRRSELSQRKT